MSATTTNGRTARASRAPDPLAVAREKLAELVNATTRATANVADAKLVEAIALEAFLADAAKEEPVKTSRLAVERAQILERRHLDEEGAARAEVEKLEREAHTRDYEAAIARTISLPLRLAPALARLAELDAEVAGIIDGAIADLLVEQRAAFDEATRLEDLLRPVINLKARNVAAIPIAEVKHLVRVHLTHARRAAGRDDLADGWLAGEPEPRWNDVARPAWERALQLLGITTKND